MVSRQIRDHRGVSEDPQPCLGGYNLFLPFSNYHVKLTLTIPSAQVIPPSLREHALQVYERYH
jgi:hypothetical protein